MTLTKKEKQAVLMAMGEVYENGGFSCIALEKAAGERNVDGRERFLPGPLVTKYGNFFDRNTQLVSQEGFTATTRSPGEVQMKEQKEVIPPTAGRRAQTIGEIKSLRDLPLQWVLARLKTAITESVAAGHVTVPCEEYVNELSDAFAILIAPSVIPASADEGVEEAARKYASEYECPPDFDVAWINPETKEAFLAGARFASERRAGWILDQLDVVKRGLEAKGLGNAAFDDLIAALKKLDGRR